MNASSIDDDIIQAYRGTEYRVVVPAGQFTLRIGEASDALLALHAAHGVQSSLFITAWNPYSRPTSAEDNVLRQDALQRDLRELGGVFFEGVGQHPTNGSPGEPSLLALSVELEQGKDLGHRYEQNAVVWCGSDAVPQLILLR